MNTFKITYTDGSSFITSANGTAAEFESYLRQCGGVSVDENPETGEETIRWLAKVEQIFPNPAAAPAPKGPAILTTRLNKYGGHQLVLVKSTGYAYTYANRTQAGKKAAALQAAGIACHVTAFYPFYIAIEESK